jgi:hypothetical protein
MKIRLHQEAAIHFNEEAVEFLYELKPDEITQKQAGRTQRNPRVPAESSASHIFISDTMTEKDIIKVSSSGYVDLLTFPGYVDLLQHSEDSILYVG